MSVLLSRPARLAAAGVALCAALAYGLELYDTFAQYPDRPLAVELWRQARYSTYLTALLILIAFARIAVTGRVSAGWAAGLTLWSVTVGTVYHGLLARDLTGLSWWADQGMHTLVPGAVALWWAGFAPKATLHLGHPRLWLAWPGVYAGYVLLRGEIDGRHPYFFIDPPLSGWPTVVLWCVGLTVMFWIAGVALVGLARVVSSARGRRGNAAPADPRPR